VIGGGFIAAEMGHVFSAFGASVTIVQRGPRLLMAEDEEISARFTDLARRRFRLETDAEVVGLAARDGSVEATVRAGNSRKTIVADALLVAAGRRPNTDLIDAEAGELAIDRHGHLIVDDRHRTSVEGVWALGDAANHFQLKHMANAEMRVVRHNLLHPERPKRTPVGLVPHAVFSEPQIAAVGLTERQARATGRDISVALRSYSDTAYGWALEDSTGFVKLVADRNARSLLGAHILGPHAAILIQPLLQAMMLGQSVDELAHDVLYIHPALTEVVEQALLDL
jgi:mycothione reductase